MAAIPTDLHEALRELEAQLSDREKAHIRQLDETEFTTTQHMSLGMYLRNEWLYPENSPMRKFFENEGLSFEDDMSRILLTSLHRYLLGNDIRYEEQLEGAVRYGLLKNKNED